MPQPIETAPKDETPILTDCGIVKWGHDNHCGWLLCSPQGWPYRGEDSDYIHDRPTLWEPLPDWIAK